MSDTVSIFCAVRGFVLRGACFPENSVRLAVGPNTVARRHWERFVLEHAGLVAALIEAGEIIVTDDAPPAAPAVEIVTSDNAKPAAEIIVANDAPQPVEEIVSPPKAMRGRRKKAAA